MDVPQNQSLTVPDPISINSEGLEGCQATGVKYEATKNRGDTR